jgi:hypothetical protein
MNKVSFDDDLDEIEDDTSAVAGTVPATTATSEVMAPPGHKLVNPFLLFRQLNSGGALFKGDYLVKMDHNTGALLIERGGDIKGTVEAGARFVANPDLMIDTWTKYGDGKVLDRRFYRTALGEMAPPRDELPDADWEAQGKRKDPWGRAVHLPMKDGSGAVCAFKATGMGAIAEIADFVGMYGSANRGGKHPVVEIDKRSFESRHGSKIHVPVFRLVDWTLWEDGRPAPAVQPVAVPLAPPAKPTAAAKKTQSSKARDGDLDDAIPF